MFLELASVVDMDRTLSATEIMLLANLLPDETETKTILDSKKSGGLAVDRLSEVSAVVVNVTGPRWSGSSECLYRDDAFCRIDGKNSGEPGVDSGPATTNGCADVRGSVQQHGG